MANRSIRLQRVIIGQRLLNYMYRAVIVSLGAEVTK